MLGDATAGSATPLQDSLNVRIETLQQVLMGEMTPQERRVGLAERRRLTAFRATGSPLTSRTTEKNDTVVSEEEPEQESPEFETADSVEIEVGSPSKDDIRVANFLASKYPDTDGIILSEEGVIKVREPSKDEFLVDVSKMLEEDFGVFKISKTVETSTPSMTVAAERQSD
jgi:hypothetical protein